MSKVNVVESGLTPRDAQISIELFDRFPVGRRIQCVDMPLRLGMRPRPRNLQSNVGRPRNWIVESCQACRRRYIHVVKVYACGIGTALGEFSFLQGGADIKIGAGLPSPQRATSKRKLM